jgi:hypothetical protein
MIVATFDAWSQVSQFDIQQAVNRHLTADWGNIDSEKREANKRALLDGGLLFSSYLSSQNIRFHLTNNTNQGYALIVVSLSKEN